MKYSNENKPLVCMMTQSTCYQGTKPMDIKGVLVHSTGANNTTLKRYVQPDDDAPNRAELIEIIGENKYKNDWNHITRSAGLNAWIGKLADGTVATVQTMPWNYRPWGCASGAYGSCNDGWIQFEVCEDGLTDATYFAAVYEEMAELIAYLCTEYTINPKAVVEVNGVNVPTVLCHADAHALGFGSNHGDILHWFKKHNVTMDMLRNKVSSLMSIKEEEPSSTPIDCPYKVGDAVRILPGAKYASGGTIPAWVQKSKLYVRQIKDNGDLIISIKTTGAITGTVKVDDVTLYEEEAQPDTNFTPYLVRVNTPKLNVRAGAGTSYKVNSVIYQNELYTIVAQRGNWGKLKSGAGWIDTVWVKKV